LALFTSQYYFHMPPYHFEVSDHQQNPSKAKYSPTKVSRSYYCNCERGRSIFKSWGDVQPSWVHAHPFPIFPSIYHHSICHHYCASFPAKHFPSQPVAVLAPDHMDRPSIIQSHPFHLSNQMEHIKFHHKTPIANQPSIKNSPFPNHIPPHFSALVHSNGVYLPT